MLAGAKVGPVMKPMEIRILGFMNSPNEANTAMNTTRVCDFEMMVKPETTVRNVKDFSMARMFSIQYQQLTVEFWDQNLKDATTMQGIVDEWPFFLTVKCLHLHIIIPDLMFREMYKTLIDLGVEEEAALNQTKSFMKTPKIGSSNL